jgi:hypothetical protein
MPAAYEINSLLNSLLNVEVSDGTAAHSEQIDALLPPGTTQQHESLIQRAGELMQDMSFFFSLFCALVDSENSLARNFKPSWSTLWLKLSKSTQCKRPNDSR